MLCLGLVFFNQKGEGKVFGQLGNHIPLHSHQDLNVVKSICSGGGLLHHPRKSPPKVRVQVCLLLLFLPVLFSQGDECIVPGLEECQPDNISVRL